MDLDPPVLAPRALLQSVHEPTQTRVLVRRRLGEQRGWLAVRLLGLSGFSGFSLKMDLTPYVFKTIIRL